MSKSALPMFSCKSFIISGLRFRFLIHFEFIFMYGIRECSNFILWHVAVQFSQHHLLEGLSFLHCVFLLSLIICTGCVGLFWGFLFCSIFFFFCWFFFFFFFVLVPYCFDDCSFVLKSEVRPLFLMYKWNVFILNETVLTVFSIWQLEFIIRNNVF